MPALAFSNPRVVADIENYLFGTVGPHFRLTGEISKEDFWLILIWKSNRSKNATRRAMEKGHKNFDLAISSLATFLHQNDNRQARIIELVIRRQLGLATATVILTVLDPDSFTVYDYRVCEQLESFQSLKHCSDGEILWQEYERFVAAVRAYDPSAINLRANDKALWGRSLLASIDLELGKNVPKRKSNKNRQRA